MRKERTTADASVEDIVDTEARTRAPKDLRAAMALGAQRRPLGAARRRPPPQEGMTARLRVLPGQSTGMTAPRSLTCGVHARSRRAHLAYAWSRSPRSPNASRVPAPLGRRSRAAARARRPHRRGAAREADQGAALRSGRPAFAPPGAPLADAHGAAVSWPPAVSDPEPPPPPGPIAGPQWQFSTVTFRPELSKSRIHMSTSRCVPQPSILMLSNWASVNRLTSCSYIAGVAFRCSMQMQLFAYHPAPRPRRWA